MNVGKNCFHDLLFSGWTVENDHSKFCVCGFFFLKFGGCTNDTIFLEETIE